MLRLASGVLLIVLATALLGFGVLRTVEQELRAGAMKRASAMSLGYDAPGHGRNRDRWARVEFVTEDGAVVRTRYGVIGGFQVPDAGTPTEILYDPADPGAVLPASPFQRLFAPVAGSLVALLGLLLGFAITFGARAVVAGDRRRL